MIKFTLQLFFFIISFQTFTQSNTIVNGIVVDKDSKPLAFVTIQALDFQNQIVKGDFTDEDGKFVIEVPSTTNSLILKYAGLQNDTIKIQHTKNNLDLGILTLKSIEDLDGIEIIAQRSNMEYHLDKRVFNVGSDLNNQGSNAVDVLENIPSITVDAEGNISLRGNSNVRILIDGKMSGFASSADALKQLQAANIEKIEVITNASSRYDAQGEGGIINIILKKNQTKGLTGSASVRVGYFPELGGDFRINYRKNKFNLTASYSINSNSIPGYSNTYQRLNNPDTSFAYKQNYEHLRRKTNHHGAIGMDLYLNDFNTLTLGTTIRSGLGNNLYDRYYDNFDANDNHLSYNNRFEKQKELEDLFELSLSYNKKFKNKANWSTDFKWFMDQDIERSNYNETSSLFGGERVENSQVKMNENNFLGQSDFVLPFLKEGKFEGGLRVQIRQMENVFSFGQLNGNIWDYPTIYNDRFQYNEQVYAGYAMASHAWKKLSIQAGLRAENALIQTNQTNSQTQIKKSFLDLFPSGVISFKNTQNQTFQISYSRRISRPGQWDLMPFTKFGDNRERRIGNGNLNPEYTNSLEGGILQTWNTGSFLGSIYYRHTTDKIERISALAADGIIYITPYNIASKDAYGIELNVTYNPKNWIRFSSGFNVFQEEIRGQFNNETFKRKNFTWTNRTSVNFSFPKIVKAQIAFNYTAPSVRPQGKTLANYHFDLGFSRDMIKGKATLGLNIRDLFNTRKWRSEIDTPELYAISSTLWRPRTITLVFTYRFNQTKKDSGKADFNLLDERSGE